MLSSSLPPLDGVLAGAADDFVVAAAAADLCRCRRRPRAGRRSVAAVHVVVAVAADQRVRVVAGVRRRVGAVCGAVAFRSSSPYSLSSPPSAVSVSLPSSPRSVVDRQGRRLVGAGGDVVVAGLALQRVGALAAVDRVVAGVAVDVDVVALADVDLVVPGRRRGRRRRPCRSMMRSLPGSPSTSSLPSPVVISSLRRRRPEMSPLAVNGTGGFCLPGSDFVPELPPGRSETTSSPVSAFATTIAVPASTAAVVRK